MREPVSQSENTAGEKRHSHILEANRTCEPAYFLYFISTNCVLRRALWHECPPSPGKVDGVSAGGRRLCHAGLPPCRLCSSFFTRCRICSSSLFYPSASKMICSIMTSRCFLLHPRILIFPDAFSSFSTPLTSSRQRNISN